MQSGAILSEWTDERESGAIDYRLVVTGSGDMPAGDAWLEARYRGDPFESGEELAQDWEEEELDDAGHDLLKHLPAMVSEIAAAERARIRRELLVEITKSGAIFAQEVWPAAAVNYLEAALDRICPEEG